MYMMRIEWIYPFISPGEYLIWASICKTFRDFLQARQYSKTTSITSLAYSLDMVKWGLQNGCPNDYRLYKYAIRQKDVSMVIQMTNLGIRWLESRDLCREAINTRDLRMVSFVLNFFGKWPFSCSFAIKNRDPVTLEWLVNNGLQLYDTHCKDIVLWGDLEVIKKFIPLSYYGSNLGLCDLAAITGRLDVLKWLHSQGFAITSETVVSAVLYEQAEVLNWLIQMKCPISIKAHILASQSSSIIIRNLLA